MPYRRGNFIANRSQAEAITHPPAPLMILAGAGTGKTTTLVHRILYLIEELQAEPASILAITYTEKAAQELKDRIIAAVGVSAEVMTVATFHAFCYQIVKENTPRPPTLIDDGDAVFLLLDRFDQLGPLRSREFVSDPVRAVTVSFIPFINRLRDELIDPAEMPVPEADSMPPDTRAQLADLRLVYERYKAWKGDLNQVDFGDMILQCRDFLENDSELLHQLQERYRHLIVDEFQDNNDALNTILGNIAQVHGSITVVGDDDQVIYGFRGASGYNIRDFLRRYSGREDFKKVSLESNYRSTQPILDLANAVIKNNRLREPKELLAHRQPPNPSRPRLLQGDTATQNAALPGMIRELTTGKGYSFGQIAVLCRTRRQVREAARHLRQAHIPVHFFLTEYFKIPALRQLMAWCQVVARGPHADDALYRLLETSLGSGTAQAIFSRYRRRDPTPRLELIRREADKLRREADPPAGGPGGVRVPPAGEPAGAQEKGRVQRKPSGLPGGEKLDHLLEDITYLQSEMDRKKLPADEMVWLICRRIRLLRPLVQRYEWRDRVALVNLGATLQRSQDFTRRHREDNSLYRFVLYMDTLQQAGSISALVPQGPQLSSAVIITTIHGAKGRQFPVVIVPYNQVQRFPVNFRASKVLTSPPEDWLDWLDGDAPTPAERHREEERRLFYVAVTRAQDRLILLAPEKRTSPFIKEIPDKMIERSIMEPVTNQQPGEGIDTLRLEYEQRITEALANDQFDLIPPLLAAVRRLAEVQAGKQPSWGAEPWEKELKTRLEKQPPVTLPDTLALSASAMETYAQCPLKYRLGYIDKIPETAGKPQLIFGSIIHRVLEVYHREGLKTEAELLELLDKHWQPEGFDYASREASFKEQGVELLQRYHRYLGSNPPEVVATEYPFQFELEKCSIRGVIDRIDRSEKGYRVLDYKTSRTTTPARDSLQLAIYSLFLTRRPDLEFGGLPEAADLFFLRHEEEPVRSHSFTAEELDGVGQKIQAVVSGIRNREFDYNTGYHCQWCDYQHLLCPAWEED